MDIETLIKLEEINDTVKIHAKYVAKNIDDMVLITLREKYEARCTEHGYIRRGSIVLKKIVAAQVEYHTLHGYVNVFVVFDAKVFRPKRDTVVWTKIVDSNEFGYKASSFLDGEPVLDVIIPLSMNMYNVDSQTQKITIGDMMKVKLLDVRTDHQSNILSAIAHIGETAQVAPESSVEEGDDAINDEVVLGENFAIEDDDSDSAESDSSSSVEVEGTDDDSDSIVVDDDELASSESESLH
jgi:DNA-directed RNA polymerase subunit E'/Rpb7